jgi:hypothetical protein
LVAEELITASVHSGEYDEGSTAIECRDQGCRTFHRQIGSARGHRNVRVSFTAHRYIFNLREPLEAQRLFCQILWR